MTNSSDRPHRTSQVFVCFTSRLSSSMKISSKSILSTPGRSRETATVSLSTSLSRRLRTNGSLKGGQSPMFPTGGGKKRGCAFENPEPSSPKVTCIGQVRVKTKKQGKKIRTRRVGEVSFRRVDQIREGSNQSHINNTNNNNNNQASLSSQSQQHQQECLNNQRNQRWVHLPLTICEALRGFGAEFSCLFPCRSSCFSTSEEREKDVMKSNGSSTQGNSNNHSSSSSSSSSSCGAVFARWFVALQDGEGGKGREIELVVGGEDEEEERTFSRHGVGEIKFKDEEADDEVKEEEEARVSICIPPKNALLLMRCRSDPVRMSALTNRFWESPAPKCDQQEEEEEEEEEEEAAAAVIVNSKLLEEKKDEMLVSIKANEEEQKNTEAAEVNVVMEVEEENLDINDELGVEEEENQEPEVDKLNGSLSETVIVDPEKNLENDVDALSINQHQEEENEEERRLSHHSSSVVSVHAESVDEEVEAAEATSEEEPTLEEEEEEGEEEEKSIQEKETTEEAKEEEIVCQERSKSEESEEERESEESSSSNNSVVLPDCLLLMKCEPKLSMEVSKETWVCGTDFFIRRLPERHVKSKDGDGDEPTMKNRISADSNPPLPQPPRSSCSMATMIEEKLVNAVGCEPLVLTRCKSEPMQTAAAKLAPETCFWKNRKLEPHRRATVGVGAAGVGF